RRGRRAPAPPPRTARRPRPPRSGRPAARRRPSRARAPRRARRSCGNGPPPARPRPRTRARTPSRSRPRRRSRGRAARPVPSPRLDVIVPAVRVHILSDMEGVAGIVKWQQTTGGEKPYDEGRVLYTEEINAAVRGARAGGATEIVVMDCHGAGKGWDFNSLLPELLDPHCEFVVQHEWTEYTGF